MQGHTQASIATRLAIKQPTVCEDLKRIRQQWRVSTVRDFDAACDLELQKLDRVEREAWAAYERSQKPAQSAAINADGKTRKNVKNRNGDLRARMLSSSVLRYPTFYPRARRPDAHRLHAL